MKSIRMIVLVVLGLMVCSLLLGCGNVSGGGGGGGGGVLILAQGMFITERFLII